MNYTTESGLCFHGIIKHIGGGKFKSDSQSLLAEMRKRRLKEVSLEKAELGGDYFQNQRIKISLVGFHSDQILIEIKDPQQDDLIDIHSVTSFIFSYNDFVIGI